MKIVLLGLEFDNNNKGCEALSFSFVKILKSIAVEKGQELSLSAIVYSKDQRLRIEEMAVEVECYQMYTKDLRFWARSFKMFRECDAIFDFTMGDSFSDIYGMKRFVITTMLKQIAIFSGSTFILGPQTYGPYKSKIAQFWARKIINKSTYVFARDGLSKEYIKKLCNREIPEAVDVAFSLPYTENSKISDKDHIHIGFNPSGLLYAGGYTGKNQFSLKVNYQKYCDELLGILSKSSQYTVHLVPHVWSENLESIENDLAVCYRIKEKYPDFVMAPDYSTSMSLKSYISGMDIFIGARMHATIAAFSSGVATIPFSYSRKFEGLYNSLGYPFVISALEVETEEAIKTTLKWIDEYVSLHKNVEESMDIVNERVSIFHNALYDILY